MKKYDELLERAMLGRVTREEFTIIAAQLEEERPEVDTYRLLHILGLSQDTSYRRLVESFLHRPDDPMLSRLAVQILCNYWNDAGPYLPELLRFIKWVPWDTDEDVRHVAISQAGNYLRSHRDEPLLAALLEVWENESEDQLTRQAAYTALGRAIGREWRDLPLASRLVDLDKVDHSIIATARKRLQARHG